MWGEVTVSKSGIQWVRAQLVTVVRRDVREGYAEDIAIAAEIHVEVVVVHFVVIGSEDKRKELLFPHLASDIVDHFGFGTVEFGRPAAELSLAVSPFGAVIPVFDQAVQFAFVIPKSSDIDGISSAMLADDLSGSIVGANGATAVGSVMHGFDDLGFHGAQHFAQFGHGYSQFTAHQHTYSFVVP